MLKIGKTILLSFIAAINASSCAITQANQAPTLLIHAAHVFDGKDMRSNASVLISNGQISQIGERDSIKAGDAHVIDLGDATLLPGFIDLHTHIAFQHIPEQVVLRHGVTTVRDVGGSLHAPYGGDGSLRVLSSGPIITAVGGYPIPSMGATNIAIPVASASQARETVRQLVTQGAVVIKIALEPGGETGAPWSAGHGHGHEQHAEHTDPHAAHKAMHGKSQWPLLSEDIVKAIVDEAHKQGRKVTAHLAEPQGATLALNAGVDEWAHLPCDKLPDELLKKAVTQKVTFVTTLDTLSKCAGIAYNTQTLAALGGEFLYGAEIAHPDIPWGIDGLELMAMVHTAHLTPLDVLRSATAKAGEYLHIPLLGTLQSGAPADLIAVKGDPTQALKTLEYPDLVVSGGKVIVNNFMP